MIGPAPLVMQIRITLFLSTPADDFIKKSLPLVRACSVCVHISEILSVIQTRGLEAAVMQGGRLLRAAYKGNS